ncbi:MAG TPA: sigma-70 family RNA polymerase sigma factor [Gaiellaceae bacterium]
MAAESAQARGHLAENGTDALAAELFRQHSRLVLGVCRRLLADAAEAEDAMQQTFVSAYRALLAGSRPRHAEVWLAAIARNECVDRIRARMREPLAGQVDSGVPGARDALAALIAGEELRALSSSIRELPAQQRDALVLHELCGLPYGEVAAAIGVTESAIGSLLFRARRSLRSTFRRARVVLPLPEAWNAVVQLVSRGPALKVAALPAVAKIGCGAVAVGLTAGTVVAVEQEVDQQPAQRAPRQAIAAPAAHTETAAAVPVRHLAPKPRAVRVSVPTPGVRVTAVRTRRPPSSHERVRRAPARKAPAAASRPAEQPTILQAPPAATPSVHSDEPPASTPVHGRSEQAHAQSGSAGDHGNGRRAHGMPASRQTPARGADGVAHSKRERADRTAPAGAPAVSTQDVRDQSAPPEPATPEASASPSQTEPAAPDPAKDHPDHPEHPGHPDHPA